MGFAGQTVVVTGASGGVGRAIARAFACEGAFVYVGYRRRAGEADQTLAELRGCGGEGATLEVDVTRRESVTGAIERVLRERKAIDVLVNNAAIVRDALFPLMTEEEWDDVIDVNLTGAFHCTKAVVRSMLACRRGAIVNVASTSALHGNPGQANYAASKGGLVALTKTLAVELAPRGLRVNAVVAGMLSTGMGARLDHRVVERLRSAIPLGRFGTGEEVANAVCFLASERASYITGEALVVDGGLCV